MGIDLHLCIAWWPLWWPLSSGVADHSPVSPSTSCTQASLDSGSPIGIPTSGVLDHSHLILPMTLTKAGSCGLHGHGATVSAQQ